MTTLRSRMQDSKQRLKAMAKNQEAISSGSFSRDGAIYAYALSYDWARGYSVYNPQVRHQAFSLRCCLESYLSNRSL